MTKQHRSKATQNDPQGHDDQAGAPEGAKWLRLLVFLNVGMLACLAAFLVRGALWPSQPAAPVVSPEQLKATAAALEERGLDAPAAAAWQRYLDEAPEDPERADILYHIGSLYMLAEQFDLAASAFVRAELAAGENKELTAKIAARLIECLGGMGRFGEVSRELARRRHGGTKPPDERQVVATIGEIKITESDLDQMVEDHVDQMLTAQGVSGDRNRREIALRQLSSPNVRARLLRELLEKELFLRRARELDLDREEDFLFAREQATQGLLLRKLQNRELKLSAPTDAELEAFYKEHLDEYRQPDQLEVLGIGVPDAKAAAAMLEKITSAADFRKQAQQIRQSEASDGRVSFRRTLYRGRVDPALGKTDALFALSEGQWTREPILRSDAALLVLVETKTAARTLPFAQVKQHVQKRCLQQMRTEALKKLFEDLMARYDVDIKLQAVPEELPKSIQPDTMVAEPGSTAAKPATPPDEPGSAPIEPVIPAAKPVTPAPGPGEPAPKPHQDVDNPLRGVDTPGEPPLGKEKPSR